MFATGTGTVLVWHIDGQQVSRILQLDTNALVTQLATGVLHDRQVSLSYFKGCRLLLVLCCKSVAHLADAVGPLVPGITACFSLACKTN